MRRACAGAGSAGPRVVARLQVQVVREPARAVAAPAALPGHAALSAARVTPHTVSQVT